MSDLHNCLHCGREVEWAEDRWVDAYGNTQCPRGPLREYEGKQFRGPHGALARPKGDSS